MHQIHQGFLAVRVPFDDTNARNLGACSSVPADGGIYAMDKGSRLTRIGNRGWKPVSANARERENIGI